MSQRGDAQWVAGTRKKARITGFLSSHVFSELVVIFLSLTAGAVTIAEEQAIAPGKFIPTFAVKYGGTAGWPPAEEAARLT